MTDTNSGLIGTLLKELKGLRGDLAATDVAWEQKQAELLKEWHKERNIILNKISLRVTALRAEEEAIGCEQHPLEDIPIRAVPSSTQYVNLDPIDAIEIFLTKEAKPLPIKTIIDELIAGGAAINKKRADANIRISIEKNVKSGRLVESKGLISLPYWKSKIKR